MHPIRLFKPTHSPYPPLSPSPLYPHFNILRPISTLQKSSPVSLVIGHNRSQSLFFGFSLSLSAIVQEPIDIQRNTINQPTHTFNPLETQYQVIFFSPAVKYALTILQPFCVLSFPLPYPSSSPLLLGAHAFGYAIELFVVLNFFIIQSNSFFVGFF